MGRKVFEVVVAVLSGAAIASLGWATQLPDQPQSYPGMKQCVPVYYSGLECCKTTGE